MMINWHVDNAMKHRLEEGIACTKQSSKNKTHATVIRVANGYVQWKRQWFHFKRWGLLNLRQLKSAKIEEKVVRVEGEERELVRVGEGMDDLPFALMRWKEELLKQDEEKKKQEEEMRRREEEEKKKQEEEMRQKEEEEKKKQEEEIRQKEEEEKKKQ